MRLIVLTLIFILPVYNGFCQNFGGNPSSVKWYQVNTDRARVIFPKGLDSQAQRVAYMMKMLGDTTASTIGGIQKKWSIILQNQSTISNAYVRMAPAMSELYMMPPQDNFSTGSIRWDDNLVIHENRHIQQLSSFNRGFTKLFSFILGQEGQLLANGMTIPDYFFEGDAVWQETLVSAQGRGRMPSFYNGFKSLWLEKKDYSWMKLRNGSLKDFVPDHYATGYLLTAYGYEKYGDSFWEKVTGDAVRFKGVFYPFNNAIKKYSGRSYRQFRQDALLYFKQKSIPENISTGTTEFDYITGISRNTIIDYQFPHFISDDSVLVTRKSAKEISAFYLISKGKEEKIRVRDIGLDDYYSYKNGHIVFAAYQADPRWANQNYSVIKLLDIYSGEQRQITNRSKYFSPDISANGQEILAISVNPDGTNNLCRLNAISGNLIKTYDNPANHFFTQTKYVNNNTAISAVRSKEGKMALMKINFETGAITDLTPFSFNVLGYPFVKNDTVYFSAMYENADNVFAVSLLDNKLFRLTNNMNGVYYPAVNTGGDMLVSAFTAGGYRLAELKAKKIQWKEISDKSFVTVKNPFFTDSLQFRKGAGSLYSLADENSTTKNVESPVSRYRGSFRLFNFHSWRPVVNDPEYGYTFYSDNVLSNFKTGLTYLYNRTDRSHTLGISSIFAGWFPVLALGVEESFNRTVDTAFNKSVSYNAATLKAGLSVPLRFVNGRTIKLMNAGLGYNIEQYYYRGVGKNVFSNKAINYMNAFLNLSNASRQAVQHINPRWAQSVSLNYRDALNFRDSYKFVGHASFYFPGLFANHSLVINTAFQKRDTLPDLFSKNFSYSRGYEALSTRRMYKFALNYQFPVVYPDWGFANLLYFQRIRANAFYDHTSAKARVNNLLTEIKNRSTGAEIYFDTKIWNAYPVSVGLRFSHLLDTDRLNPLLKNRWEIIIPIGLIPD